ncbi:MAG TPA: ABC transporter ATP-binding protein [Acidimicrobiales bacterium]|nr:ABC transporter ATP-binding protein [Acidimicrobiales bacterium]
MLQVERLSVTLGGTRALHDMTTSVNPGGWLGVVGPNGAGKSTLIKAICGLVPYGGCVRIAGRDLGSKDRRRRARAVAYVPQRPVLPREMNVTDYVLLGRSAHHGYLGAETARDRRTAAAVIERLELAHFASRPLGALSGGESQRAVLARALVQEAPVLVMDEPTTSLDLGHSQLVLELADELRRERGICVLCALHDLTLAAQYSETVLVLFEGRAVVDGAPADVLTEENISRYFAASVQVLEGASGPVVAPSRSAEPSALTAPNEHPDEEMRAS